MMTEEACLEQGVLDGIAAQHLLHSRLERRHLENDRLYKIQSSEAMLMAERRRELLFGRQLQFHIYMRASKCAKPFCPWHVCSTACTI